MTKKGPLSKAEQFYIESKYADLGLEGICKELDRAKGVVKKFAEKNKLKAKQEDEPKKEPDKTLLAEQFGYNRGSTIMTQNASEMLDSKRPQLQGAPKNRNCTVTIRRQENG